MPPFGLGADDSISTQVEMLFGTATRPIHVISYNEKDESDTITYRMALIWKHVSENYPDFKWYARFWDDNYVIPSTFEALINVSSPLKIRRLALANEGGRLVPVNSEALMNEAMHPSIDG